MKKILLLGLFVLTALAVLFVVSCAPGEGAIAGKAIDLGNRNRDTTVRSCTESSSSITVLTGGRITRDGLTGARTTVLSDGCQGSTFTDYSCPTSTMQRRHQVRCSSSELCVNDPANPCVARCTDTDPTNDMTVRGDVTITQTGIVSSDFCTAPSSRSPSGQLRQVDCNRGRLTTSRAVSCPSGRSCLDGVCVVPIIPPPASNVQGAAAPVTVTTTGTQVTVAVGGSPLVQLDATTTTNLGAVGVQIEGSRVVVTNAAGIPHQIYVRNTGNNGAYVCPAAQALAEVSPTCSGVISYTDAQCLDTTFTACQYDTASNSYIVSVSGTGADEVPPPPVEICDGTNNTANGVIDEGCDDDNDGYCDASMLVEGTPAVCPNGGGDCGDSLPLINPGAVDVCSTYYDDNCNGIINDGCTAPQCTSESVLVPLNFRQPLREVKPIVTAVDLPELLVSGSVTNAFDTSTYTQDLSFEITNSSITFEESNDDITSHFFLMRNYQSIALYKLTFSPTWTSSTSGTRLLDFENTVLNILGEDYVVAFAQRPTTALSQGIRLILMKEATRDTLREGETRSYAVEGRTYDVNLDYVDEDQCKFIVNSEATNLLRVGDSYIFADRTEIFVNSLEYEVESLCTFYIGTERIELRDDRITASDQSRWGTPLSGAFPVRVGSDSIDGTVVIISGNDDATMFNINSIAVNMTAKDEYYVGRGQLLSDIILAAGDERELLFTNDWDIRFNEFNTATNSGTVEIGKICPAYLPVCIDYDADAANPELVPGGALGLGYAWEYNPWSMQLRGDTCQANPEGGVRVFERYCISGSQRAWGRMIACPAGTTCVTENSCG